MSLLIAIEGLDGSGKSTLVKALVNQMHLDGDFYPWIYASKEPGSMFTGQGKQLRKMVLETPDFKPIERELLFYVDASLHSRFIANQTNSIVISDRGYWSHLAYLRGYLKTKQIDYDDYKLCKAMIERVCHKPDCVIYLNADLDLMKERLAGKEKDAIERNDQHFFSEVLDTYKDLVTQREFDGYPLLSLSASDNISNNVDKVINYLKGAFNARNLKEGNRELCRI